MLQLYNLTFNPKINHLFLLLNINKRKYPKRFLILVLKLASTWVVLTDQLWEKHEEQKDILDTLPAPLCSKQYRTETIIISHATVTPCGLIKLVLIWLLAF